MPNFISYKTIAQFYEQAVIKSCTSYQKTDTLDANNYHLQHVLDKEFLK